MKVFNQSEIIQHLPKIDDLASALKQSYIDFSGGNYDIPPVGCLSLPHGEMHIKYGRSFSSPYAAIKIASGSYNNIKQGLPASSGCILIVDTETGFPIALLQDEGLLTDIRTSVSGAMMAKHFMPDANEMGIIGCGTQGYYQALHTCQMLAINKVNAFDLSPENAKVLKHKLQPHDIEVKICDSIEWLCNHSDIITTVTPSKKGYLDASWLKQKVLVNAFGCDTTGKQELKNNVLTHAGLLLADSYSQCTDHGELQYADNHTKGKVIEFGQTLSQQAANHTGIIVADYTGVACQDITIATIVYDNIMALNHDKIFEPNQ